MKNFIIIIISSFFIQSCAGPSLDSLPPEGKIQYNFARLFANFSNPYFIGNVDSSFELSNEQKIFLEDELERINNVPQDPKLFYKNFNINYAKSADYLLERYDEDKSYDFNEYKLRLAKYLDIYYTIKFYTLKVGESSLLGIDNTIDAEKVRKFFPRDGSKIFDNSSEKAQLIREWKNFPSNRFSNFKTSHPNSFVIQSYPNKDSLRSIKIYREITQNNKISNEVKMLKKLFKETVTPWNIKTFIDFPLDNHYKIEIIEELRNDNVLFDDEMLFSAIDRSNNYREPLSKLREYNNYENCCLHKSLWILSEENKKEFIERVYYKHIHKKSGDQLENYYSSKDFGEILRGYGLKNDGISLNLFLGNIASYYIPSENDVSLEFDNKIKVHTKNGEGLKPKIITINDLEDEIDGLDYAIIFWDEENSLTRKKVTSSEKSSRFLNRVEQKYNVEYDIVSADFQRCTYNYQSELNRARDYECAGGGFVGGLACGLTRNRIKSKAEDMYASCKKKMRNTPQFIENKIFSNYSYTLTKFNIKKETTLKSILINFKTGEYKEFKKDISDSQSFEIPYRLHDKDENKQSIIRRYDTEKKLDNFEKSKLNYDLSNALDNFMNISYEGKFNKRKFVKNMDKRTTIQKERKEFVSPNNLKDNQKVSFNDKRFQSVVVIRNPNGGLGTGFYIAKNIIATNSHVVEGSNFVDIELKNGTSSFGKIIKSDSDLDIALIRAEASGKPVSFANKFEISIGERADVIGHPRGLTFSLTRGIVSAVRTMWGNKYIQTDAAISPGNSGGPMFQNGKVIGMSTWKRIDEGSEGLGFALHVDEIQSFISDY